MEFADPAELDALLDAAAYTRAHRRLSRPAGIDPRALTLWLRSSAALWGLTGPDTLSRVLCARCGHHEPADARFCSSCGAPLEPAADENTLTLPAVEAAGDEDELARLPRRAAAGGRVARRAPRPERGLVVPAREPSTPTSAATPTRRSSSTTSPCRAATSCSTARRDGYTLRDVGSLNGTYVNRERVDEAHAAATATRCRSAATG